MNQINLRVVIEQEALNDQDVGLLIGISHIGGKRHSNTMRASKLHWVLNPALYCVGHGLHVQSCDHCGTGLMGKMAEIVDTRLE